MAAKGQTLAEFGNLYPAESKLLSACRDGTVAVISLIRPSIPTRDNRLRSSFIRFLACGGDERTTIHPNGIRLWGAVIEGDINLQSVKIVGSLILSQCLVFPGFRSGSIFLNDTVVDGVLSLEGTALYTLSAYRLRVRKNFFLKNNFSALGPVHLSGAEIGSQFVCDKAKFESAGIDCLNFDDATIKGGVSLDGCIALGQVSFLGAGIGGQLSCARAKFENTGNTCLSFDRARIKGGVFLEECVAIGEVRFLNAEIGGQLSCARAKFENTGNTCLSFDGARIKGSIFLDECMAIGEIRFLVAEIGDQLSCLRAKFDNNRDACLSFDGARIKGSVFLKECVASGEVRFLGAEIGGELSCERAEFKISEGTCLNFSRATIRVAVILKECIAIGGVEFLGAEIGGQLLCDGARFQANKGAALTAEGVHIKGHLSMRGLEKKMKKFQLIGELNLASANIDSGLIIENAELEGVLRFIHVSVGQEFRLRKLKGPLSNSDFRHMQCGVLNDDVDAWGDKNKLNGFVYAAFTDVVRQGNQKLQAVSTNAESRIKWLKRQMPRDEQDSYRPQPWRHLQRTLRAMGHDTEAREVGIAHQKVRREYGVIGQPTTGAGYGARLYARTAGILHDFYGHLTGYGYKPLKLIPFILGFWLLFGGIYSIAAQYGHMGPTNPLIFQNEKYISYDWREQLCIPDIRDDLKSEPSERSINWYYLKDLPAEYTGFSPFGFSLDLLLPVVDLMQDKDWGPLIPTPEKSLWQELTNFSPPHWVRIAMWVETLIGWFFSLLIVAVISGMARNTRDDE